MEQLTFLTEGEKSQLRILADNEGAMEALRKVLLAGIYFNGTLSKEQKADPTKNFALALAFNHEFSNEQIGADLRASANGILLLENALKKVLEFKTPEVKVKKENQAR